MAEGREGSLLKTAAIQLTAGGSAGQCQPERTRPQKVQYPVYMSLSGKITAPTNGKSFAGWEILYFYAAKIILHCNIFGFTPNMPFSGPPTFAALKKAQ